MQKHIEQVVPLGECSYNFNMRQQLKEIQDKGALKIIAQYIHNNNLGKEIFNQMMANGIIKMVSTMFL